MIRLLRYPGLALLVTSLGLAAGCNHSQSTTATATSPSRAGTSAPGPAANPEIKTTAEALAKEALADRTAAEAKYKGKVVELDGTVDQANPVIGDGKGIHLVGAKAKPTDVVGMGVMCIPAEPDKDKVWWLGRGEKVRVVGEVTGINPLGVYLDRCTVTEEGPNPTPKVTAEQLTAEFAKDEAAAKKKFLTAEGYPKEVIVEGTVADLVKTPNDFYKVRLAGSEGQMVDGTVKKESFDQLKKGDKVTIKGDLSGYSPQDKGVTLNTAFLLKKG